MGGARNGEDMNGEEIDVKERTRSHAERLGESNGELGALAELKGRGAEVNAEESRLRNAAEEAAMRGGRIIPLGI